MSVKTKHQSYENMKAEWKKCLDFMTSEKAVKERDGGTTYLPVLTEQEPDEYKAYKNRTPVIMFAQRANRAMCGMIGRKEPVIKGLPNKQEYLKDDIDSVGGSMVSYISMIMGKFLQSGRGCTLIDVPYVKEKITIKRAEELGIRPRFYYYDELSLINWRTSRINNMDQLVLVILKESKVVMSDDDNFTWEVKDQYRVLELIDGIYQISLYDHDGKLVPDSLTQPKMNNKPMNFIPAVIHGGVDVQQPPLNAIVDINLHHYQLSADEMHGLRMAALPTPYFFGKDPNDDDFPTHTGPTRMIGCEDANAKTGFREFSGAGLASVAAKLKQFADDIAMLSVQMATEQINKSATGSSIDYGNSTASLAGTSSILSAEMTQALKIAVEWAGGDPEKVECNLNKDFMPAGMDANMFQALLKAYLSGTITYDTYYANLARGEITDPGKDSADEKREIEDDLPPGMIFGDLGGDDEENNQDDSGEE